MAKKITWFGPMLSDCVIFNSLSLKGRSHIPTRLNSRVGSLSVCIWDRGLQQQSGLVVRLIRRVVRLEMSKINDPIVGSFEGLLVYVTPITTRPDGRRANFYTIIYQGPCWEGV